MAVVANARVRFGHLELDIRSGELFKHDLKLKLQGHPIQLLCVLLERPGELVTRKEIRQRLWPAETETSKSENNNPLAHGPRFPSALTFP